MKGTITGATKIITRDVPIESLSLDPANVRKHERDDIEMLKASLKSFGQERPVHADMNNVVRAGNGILLAMKELREEGFVFRSTDAETGQEIADDFSTVTVTYSKLTKSALTAYAIADNRLAERSAWNWEDLGAQLKSLIDEGFDTASTGWTMDEILPLINANWTPPADDHGTGTSDAAKPIHLTFEQRKIFEQAHQQAAAMHGEDADTEGAALVLISRFFIEKGAQ